MKHTKQQTAFDTIIECINSNTPVLLTGFAGTGKSTTIATVIKSLSHKMITIATPTHKAAAVLSAMLETNGIVSAKRESNHNPQTPASVHASRWRYNDI